MNIKISSYKDLPLIYRLLKRFEVHRLKKVSQLIPKGKFKILEIGCNNGQFLYDNRGKWSEMTGVDISKAILEKASKRNYQIPTKFEEADFGRNKMPYKSNQFDLIVSIATMQYIYDIDLLISEVYRTLKQGGMFIFEIPNAVSFWRRINFLLGRMPRTSSEGNIWNDGVVHYFTAVDLSDFLKAKGFIIENVSCSGIFADIRQWWPDFLGGDLIYVCKKR